MMESVKFTSSIGVVIQCRFAYKCKLHVLIHKSYPQKMFYIHQDISMTGMHDLYCSVQKLILPMLHAKVFMSE